MRGRIDRAAYFDGVDDILRTTYTNTVGAIGTGTEQSTISVWVKGTRGTIFDACTGPSCERGLLLEFNKLDIFVRDSPETYEATMSFDIVENEWTHIAATIDTPNNIATSIGPAAYGTA